MTIWGVGFGIRRLFVGKGNGQRRNLKVAVNAREAQMLAAARRGNVEAQTRLAAAYADGDGVTQDYGEAAHWFGEAARRGDAGAQFSFGICHANGQGTAQDYEEAVDWFRRSADQGNAGAQVSLGLCLQKGLGAPSNQKEALQWFRRAAESGDAAGQVSLAAALQSGRGAAKNEVEAAGWFRKAAAQGLAEAEFNLGNATRTDWASRWMRTRRSSAFAAPQTRACRKLNLSWASAFITGTARRPTGSRLTHGSVWRRNEPCPPPSACATN